MLWWYFSSTFNNARRMFIYIYLYLPQLYSHSSSESIKNISLNRIGKWKCSARKYLFEIRWLEVFFALLGRNWLSWISNYYITAMNSITDIYVKRGLTLELTRRSIFSFDRHFKLRKEQRPSFQNSKGILVAGYLSKHQTINARFCSIWISLHGLVQKNLFLVLWRYYMSYSSYR